MSDVDLPLNWLRDDGARATKRCHELGLTEVTVASQTCAICGGKHDNPAKWSDDYEGMPWCILSLRLQVADQAARIAALEAEAQTRKDDVK